MLRVLVCLALVISPVQTWTASVVILICGLIQTARPTAQGNSTLLPVLLTGQPAPRLEEEWRVVLARMDVRYRHLVIECFHGQGRRRRWRFRRLRRHRRRHRWLSAVAWRKLKRVPEGIV